MPTSAPRTPLSFRGLPGYLTGTAKSAGPSPTYTNTVALTVAGGGEIPAYMAPHGTDRCDVFTILTASGAFEAYLFVIGAADEPRARAIVAAHNPGRRLAPTSGAMTLPQMRAMLGQDKAARERALSDLAKQLDAVEPRPATKSSGAPTLAAPPPALRRTAPTAPPRARLDLPSQAERARGLSATLKASLPAPVMTYKARLRSRLEAPPAVPPPVPTRPAPRVATFNTMLAEQLAAPPPPVPSGPAYKASLRRAVAARAQG